MVYCDSVIPVFKSISGSNNRMNFTDPISKSKQMNQTKNKKLSNVSNSQVTQTCSESGGFAVIDMVILVAVVGACGFLLFPYVKFTYIEITEFGALVLYVLMDEFHENPMIYGSLGLSMVCIAIATWAIVVCTSRKCGNPTCLGLWKAAEFDIQLETEDCVKNSSLASRDGVKKGLFELPRDHHRELESELKKIAPPNGRAVLVFRARCGCSVGRMEVPGPRKSRKIKK